MASTKELAILSHLVYGDMDAGLNPGDWYVDGEVIKMKSGFQAAVYRKKSTKERVVAYCGSETSNGFIDFTVDDFVNKHNWIEPQSISAMMLYELVISGEDTITKEKFYQFVDERKTLWKGDIYNWYPDNLTSNIMVTGHSLGGGLAGIVANKYGTRAKVFGSLRFLGLKNDCEIRKYFPMVNGLLENFDKQKAREKLKDDPDLLHMMDIVDLYKMQKVTIRKSTEIDGNISYYYVEYDKFAAHTYGVGRCYCVAQDDKVSFGRHSISQWSKAERYDDNGELDMNNPINWSEALVAYWKATGKIESE